MRLLRTDTLELVEKVGERELPEYAILSHTWFLGEELSFQDIPPEGSGKAIDADVKAKKGYEKAERLARLAADHGYGHCWIDTVCINKDSSAELQENLNSMYSFYSKSAVCYIFLDDFEWLESDSKPTETDQPPDWEKRFVKCRWFGRGWTLQELITPRRRIFYDKVGTDISAMVDKLGQNLDAAIEKRTGIELAILRREKEVADVNVATKMRWAAGRETTRGEDAAYCLTGLFGIWMNLFYGEGKKNAFRRLQEEILRTSSDESIFAWEAGSDPADRLVDKGFGLLAESPDQFYDCRGMAPSNIVLDRFWCALIQNGVEVYLRARRTTEHGRHRAYTVYLNCFDHEKRCPTFVLLQVSRWQYVRLGSLELKCYYPVVTQELNVAAYVKHEPHIGLDDRPGISFKYLGGDDGGVHWEPHTPDPIDWQDCTGKAIRCRAPQAIDDSYIAAVKLAWRGKWQGQCAIVVSLTSDSALQRWNCCPLVANIGESGLEKMPEYKRSDAYSAPLNPGAPEEWNFTNLVISGRLVTVALRGWINGNPDGDVEVLVAVEKHETAEKTSALAGSKTPSDIVTSSLSCKQTGRVKHWVQYRSSPAKEEDPPRRQDKAVKRAQESPKVLARAPRPTEFHPGDFTPSQLSSIEDLVRNIVDRRMPMQVKPISGGEIVQDSSASNPWGRRRRQPSPPSDRAEILSGYFGGGMRTRPVVTYLDPRERYPMSREAGMGRRPRVEEIGLREGERLLMEEKKRLDEEEMQRRLLAEESMQKYLREGEMRLMEEKKRLDEEEMRRRLVMEEDMRRYLKETEMQMRLKEEEMRRRLAEEDMQRHLLEEGSKRRLREEEARKLLKEGTAISMPPSLRRKQSLISRRRRYLSSGAGAIPGDNRSGTDRDSSPDLASRRRSLHPHPPSPAPLLSMAPSYPLPPDSSVPLGGLVPPSGLAPPSIAPRLSVWKNALTGRRKET